MIVNRPVIIQSNVDFAKKSDVEGSSSIPAALNFIRTAGYTTYGDGGAALYTRSSSEPSHAGKIQDANGVWWEIDRKRVNPRQFGATGDGSTDDRAALVNMLAACEEGTTVELRQGDTYIVGDTGTASGTILPVTVRNIKVIGHGATIKLKDSFGEYRAIFGPSGTAQSSGVQRWDFDGIVFDMNSSNSAVAQANITAQGRYAITTYTTAGPNLHVTVRHCVFKNPDSVVVLYFTANATYRDKFIDISHNSFENCRLGGDGTDYDQSFINVSGDLVHVCNNRFQGESWARVPRTAIETHASAQIVSGNIIDQFQLGMNITGIRDLDTTDKCILVCNNVMTICQNGISLWSRDTATNNQTIGVNDFVVTGNTIRHEWSEYTFALPRVGAIDLFGSSNSIDIDTIRISDNTIIYAPENAGSPAIDRTSNADRGVFNFDPPTTGIHIKHIDISNNHIENAPCALVWVDDGALSDLTMDSFRFAGNTCLNCGTASTTISTAYRAFISMLFNLPPITEIVNNHFSTEYDLTQAYRLWDYAAASRTVFIGGNTIAGGFTSFDRYLTLNNASVQLAGDTVPSKAAVQSSSSVVLAGAWANVSDLNILIKKAGTAWIYEARMTAAPTTGTWLAGSIVLNSGAAAGEPAGWMCTVAGTPGTWVTFGQVSVLTSVASTPSFVGQFAVSGGVGYMAVATSSSADWKQITA